MSLANLPAWAAGQLPAAAEPVACEEVDPGLVRVDLADGATAYVERPPAENTPLGGRPLTLREKDVLARIARGQRYDDIALDTFTTINTIKSTASRIYRKLGAESGPHAVALAIATEQLPADIATSGPAAPTSEDAR